MDLDAVHARRHRAPSRSSELTNDRGDVIEGHDLQRPDLLGVG